jgi:hypothetical protein
MFFVLAFILPSSLYALFFVSDTSVTQYSVILLPDLGTHILSDSFIVLAAYAVLYLQIRRDLCHQQSHLFTAHTADIVCTTTIKVPPCSARGSYLISLLIWTPFPSDLPLSSRAIHAAQATAAPTSVSSSTQILPPCKHTRIRSAPFVTVGKLIGYALSPPVRR